MIAPWNRPGIKTPEEQVAADLATAGRHLNVARRELMDAEDAAARARTPDAVAAAGRLAVQALTTVRHALWWAADLPGTPGEAGYPRSLTLVIDEQTHHYPLPLTLALEDAARFAESGGAEANVQAAALPWLLTHTRTLLTQCAEYAAGRRRAHHIITARTTVRPSMRRP